MLGANLLPSSTAVAILVAVCVAAGTFYAYFRTSVAKVWQGTAEGWRERATLLEQNLGELAERVKTLEVENAELKIKTDLSGFEQRQLARDATFIKTIQDGNVKLVAEISKLTAVISNGVKNGQ